MVENRNHIKFLRPGTRRLKKRGRNAQAVVEGAARDFLYAPMYAAGRVVVAAMLDTILFEAYFNPSILEIFQLLCGIRLEVRVLFT